MKTTCIFLGAMMIMNAAFAKTYTLGSGKWNDARVWGNDYTGTTVNPGDVVIITGLVTITENITINGTLQIEKGACIVGLKDLDISKTGRLINNGSIVMKRIINQGTIYNNLMMEATLDIENQGKIENNSNVVAGNDFDTNTGNMGGNGGAYYVNNTLKTSAASTFAKNVEAFYGNTVDSSTKTSVPAASPAPVLTASSLGH
jgi:hypothetical protein